MCIDWINEKYKEANRVMDTDWEIYEWADSLYSDFAGGIRVNVGYATPDYKVYLYLVEHLPRWKDLNQTKVIINTSHSIEDEKVIYKIWITSPFSLC
ncbi:hypothetical protein [Paenibacillus sp. CF384]|uniref:hypothetical protein n=1 Tax=Paenibacillus sp. CF384 TaxID=1884382 RepID=UPI0008951056|nr:hypothetical protein [Paenibacillus sp. CF384]SDW22019.1 hypothetical protein SAMN05518855_1001700 [Paenibacillus sp. CF384]